MKFNYDRLIPVLLGVLVFACGPADFDQTGASTFTSEGLESRIIKLSSDEFMGRKPFTEGEVKTLNYLEEEFKKLGLEPGNGDSYFQDVPLMQVTSQATESMLVKSPKGDFSLKGREDYVIWSPSMDVNIDLNNEEVVFAGFGIVAPEYGWNDYEGLDVKDKIVLVLVNDPGFGTDSTKFFKGTTMTYYGRWTYKYEEAARQGAKGCLVIHNTIPAGYGFNVVQNSWNAAKLYLDRRNSEEKVCDVEGWVTLATARKFFEQAGKKDSELLAAARTPEFKGESLGIRLTTSITNEVTYDVSKNAIAMIKGSESPDEYVIYTAHWDHLGVGTAYDGDSIYNGALDNASGTAALLEIAAAFKSMKKKPKRSIVFLAVTAEEQGLLGSAYYAANPVFPISQTIANINMDGINPYGKMKDIVVVGNGQSDLEDLLAEVAKTKDMYTTVEPRPEQGIYFRSDHFNFAKVGIPALYTATGIDHFEKGKEYGSELQANYTQEYYHKPSDEYDPERWDLSGALDTIGLLFEVGNKLANEGIVPEWKANSEFKDKR